MEQVSEVVSENRRGQGQLCKSDRMRGRVGERFFWIDFGPRKTGSVRDIRRKKYNSTFSTCLIVCSVKAIKGENKKRWKSKRGAALTSNQHHQHQENHERLTRGKRMLDLVSSNIVHSSIPTSGSTQTSSSGARHKTVTSRIQWLRSLAWTRMEEQISGPIAMKKSKWP